MRMAIGIAIRFEPVIEIACDIEVLKTNQRQSPCQGMGDLRVLSIAKLARAFAVEVTSDDDDIVPLSTCGAVVFLAIGVPATGRHKEATPCAIDSGYLIHTMLLPFDWFWYRSLFRVRGGRRVPPTRFHT